PRLAPELKKLRRLFYFRARRRRRSATCAASERYGSWEAKAASRAEVAEESPIEPSASAAARRTSREFVSFVSAAIKGSTPARLRISPRAWAAERIVKSSSRFFDFLLVERPESTCTNTDTTDSS